MELEERWFVLTGAGISAESGLATFRGSGGLWNGYRVDQVATPEAWEEDPSLVWNFYSMRRRDALAAQPNAAHTALVQLEARLSERFFLCTQNVDDLHEKAGTQRIRHMHGSLFESRCTDCAKPFPDKTMYLEQLPHCKICGSPVRPHIVWFGEVPIYLDEIYCQLEAATHLLVVGTSGSVYPAAGFVQIARRHRVRTIYVGPEEPLNGASFDQILLGPATQLLPRLVAAAF